MKQSVNRYDFERAFIDMNRADNYTYAGKKALFEYLEELEDGTGEEIELDVIALCCDFSEYDSALEAAKEYGFECRLDLEGGMLEDAAIGWLNDRTSVIVFNGGVIVAGF